MADVKISELSAASAPDGTELVPVVQGGDTVRTTAAAIAALAEAAWPVAPLFDYFADVGNTSTTKTALRTSAIPGDTLGTNGDKLTAEYVGVFAANGNTKTVSVEFAGSNVLVTSGALTSNNLAWEVSLTVWRVSSSVVRCRARFSVSGSAAVVTYLEITGLDLTVSLNLILYGQSGTAGDDIVSKAGSVYKVRAA